MFPETLVLTPHMTPHQCLCWHESVTLVYLGKAEVLEEYADTVSSPSVTMHVPAVIRLLKPVRRTKKDVKFSRVNVYTRDQFRCLYCGSAQPARRLTYDHVTPRVQGGRTEWSNIATACDVCNRKKGGRTPEQAGMRLLRAPRRPKWLPMTAALPLPRIVPELWRPYLAGHEVADVG
jgi:5-methylcytosine-specific restriction endonuclease McrA